MNGEWEVRMIDLLIRAHIIKQVSAESSFSLEVSD